MNAREKLEDVVSQVQPGAIIETISLEKNIFLKKYYMSGQIKLS